jgi:hypothetical protein
MTNNDKKVFGEDKLGKLVRLMKRYEEQLQQDETSRKVDVCIHLESDGSGTIVAVGSALLTFMDTDHLFMYLEGGQLTRTLMSRG